MPSFSTLTNEEHLPFSQNEHSAQHIAQQLTLLQQVHATHTQSVYILYTVYILDSGCCFPLGPLEGDISSWTLTTARTSMNVKIELYYNRRCSRDIIQFISWTPEHKESRTKSRTITSKNDASTAFWLSCMVSYHAERSNSLGYHSVNVAVWCATIIWTSFQNV